MKTRLINTKTNEETLCDKITIGGFDYYVSKADIGIRDYFEVDGQLFRCLTSQEADDLAVSNDYPKVIATNNPNIDIPKIVDETLDYKFDREFFNPLIAPIVNEIKQKDYRLFLSIGGKLYDILFENYKSQETHRFSEEDMIEFAVWLDTYYIQHSIGCYEDIKTHSIHKTKEIFQLWKQQQPKTLYYNA